ncbi:MAG TPA: DUF4410 domain-containing protein [Labilithrix sp.]
MKKGFAIAALVLALAAGCVKKGDVTERTPVGDLGAYGQTAVSVEVPDKVKDSAKHQQNLTNALVERLKKKGFDVVATDAATMIVKVKVMDVDEGSSLAAGMTGGGDAKVAMSVDLVAQKESKSLGSFDVTGNSKSNSHTSIGGVDTKAIEDRASTAMEAAADQIADFLASKRGAKN